MNLLAIDTSTDIASIALTVKAEIMSKEQSAARSHAHLLLPMIEALLAEASMKLSQLDGIVFGQGPGSFTGLRIACSVAKGLAFATDLPLYPVSSLAAIANEAFVHHQGSVLALMDARMNQLYWAYYHQQGLEGEEQVTAASDIVLNSTDKPLMVAGLSFEPYLDQIDPAVAARISGYYTIYPKAEAMIRLALSGSIKKLSVDEALPVYIRNQITQGEPRG